MLNGIWLFLVLGSIVYGAWTGRLGEVTDALFESARGAVTLVIGLVGIMVFLLGVMRVAFDGGLREAIARVLAPLLRKLMPEVPADHPAMTAMVMNLTSNMAGLGNAATPFGLKSMAELDRLNRHPGSASDTMILFLVLNTASIAVLPPLGTIGVRLAAGSEHPEAIWAPTLIATIVSAVAALAAYYALRGLPYFRPGDVDGGAGERTTPVPDIDLASLAPSSAPREPASPLRRLVVWGIGLALLGGLVADVVRLSAEGTPGDVARALLQTWLFPLLIAGLLLIGIGGRVRAYESMIQGAREGLDVAARIVPYLVAILVAAGMFRASGALGIIVSWLDPLTSRMGVPAEVLPMALLRPLSGSGAFGLMSEILEAHGPDSFIGLLASTLQGSTETTFYVLALYLGAAGVRDGRYALIACLTGDVAGFVGAVVACHWFFG
ncbi:MAG: spore maturation protein [Deltaproteobacteria bacterium]|nr:spore maturation protein [Deltaproteobacteria bacterium]